MSLRLLYLILLPCLFLAGTWPARCHDDAHDSRPHVHLGTPDHDEPADHDDDAVSLPDDMAAVRADAPNLFDVAAGPNELLVIATQPPSPRRRLMLAPNKSSSCPIYVRHLALLI